MPYNPNIHHRRSKRQTTVAAVGGEFFISAVCYHFRRQIVRTRKRVKAKNIVADAHNFSIKI
jgi:hypothetical protein